MFYDPICKPTVKANPLSLEGLIAWLETKPPQEAYSYLNGHACLLAQYLKAQGFEDVIVLSHKATTSSGTYNVSPALDDIALDRDTFLYRDKDFTFGGALKRARAHRRS